MGHEFSSINSIDSKRPLSHVFINQPEEEEGGGERGGREGMILILNFNFEDSWQDKYIFCTIAIPKVERTESGDKTEISWNQKLSFKVIEGYNNIIYQLHFSFSMR